MASSPDSPPRPPRGGLAWLAVRWVVAGGILWYLLHRIPLRAVVAAMGQLGMGHLLAAVGIAVAIQVVLAARLKTLTDGQGLDHSLAQVLGVNLVAGFYGLFVPGGTISGSAIRFYKLSGLRNEPGKTLAAITFDRVAATIALGVVGVTFWAIESPADAGLPGLVMSLALIGVLLIYLLLFSRTVVLTARRVLYRAGLRGIARRVRKLFKALSYYHRQPPRELILVAVWSIAVHLLGTLLFFVLARGLELNIDFVTIGWVRAAAVLVTMLPISVSGLGLREGTLVSLLAPYGIAGEQALALSFLFFGIRLMLMGVAGGGIEARTALLRQRPARA